MAGIEKGSMFSIAMMGLWLMGYPPTTVVLEGVEFGPAGDDYVGTLGRPATGDALSASIEVPAVSAEVTTPPVISGTIEVPEISGEIDA